jgi:glucokinase
MSEKLMVGVDLGGSKINTVLADAQGNIRARDLIDTIADEGPDAVIGRTVEAIKHVASGVELLGIGVGAAGACDTAHGIVTHSPNLPGWHNIPLRDIIQREFDMPIYLENDATVAALGEYCFGCDPDIENLIYVSVGTGIGGGIIIDGKLYHGTSGSAGEFGHMTIDINGPECPCGNIGCWETLASGTALSREAVRRIREGETTTILDHAGGDIDEVNGESVLAAADGGDRLANELIALTGYYLGVGLVNLVDIFNPQLTLIGGGISNVGALLLAPAIEVVKQRAFKLPADAVRIETARLGTDSTVLGAAALVSKNI